MSHVSTKVARTTEPNPGRSSLVAVTPAIIGVIYGYDQGNISGALLATIGSLFIVDRMGRRPTLLTGITVMILADVLMIIVFSRGTFSGGFSVPGFTGILFFTAAFDFGFGSMVWVYASESFPAQLRTLGASTMLTADLVANVIVAFFFLSALTSPGGVATFIFLLVFAVIAWLFVWWLAPETKGRPLEAIRSYWENGGKWSD